MNKVIYRVQAKYKRKFNIKGELLSVPRKDEIIEVNKMLLRVENIIHKNMYKLTLL